jgi:hypothetical protein
MRRIWLLIPAVLMAVGCGAANEPAPAVSPPAGAASSSSSPSYVPPPSEVTEPNPPTANEDGDLLRFDDGNYVAGSDIGPGYYRSTGIADGRALCSWSVSSQYDSRRGVASGTQGVTIAAGYTKRDDPQRFAIETGQQLTTAGCATWVYYGP